jgi:lipoprotein-anchoring transpeptidase ErfK/SrfK
VASAGVAYRGDVDKPILARPTRIAVVVTAVLGLLLTACSSGGSSSASKTAGTTGSSGALASGSVTPGAGSSTASSPAAPPAKPVHIKLLNSDGSTYGVGMPEIAFFSTKITSGKALQDATTATVNGKPIKGAWYFEYSSYLKGYPIEAHWRPQTYWAAHAKVHLSIPAKGLSAGKGLAFDDSLTSDWNTGARNIATVNNATHTITVTSDGQRKYEFPVSLGAPRTRTKSGIKIIMEKRPTVCMHDTNGTYYECGIKEDQRLTYDGEYLHSAPWNTYNIDHGVNSSNGCTNLHPADATALYRFLSVGDVVDYPNADGPKMQIGQGYGDWNVAWGAWLTGGLVSTT